MMTPAARTSHHVHSCRYSVRSIIGLRSGAGSAWLLHMLFAEFGVESKVAGVEQAAPKRHWRPASTAPHAVAIQQPPKQPDRQPEQPAQQHPEQQPEQQQQSGQHPGSDPLHGR